MMSKAAGIAGWVGALVLLAAMAYLARVNQDLNVRLTASNEEREKQSELSAELSKIVGELSRGLDQTQARVEEIERATAELLDRRRSGFSSFEELGDGIGHALGDLGGVVECLV